MAGTVFSIIPVALALVLAFMTRDAILAMLCAIVVGSVMLNGVNFIAPIVNDYFLDGIGGNLEIIFGLLLVGIWIELMKAGGGYRGFAKWCAKRVDTPKKALRNTFWFSLLTSFHIYLSNLLIPPMMKPSVKEHNIPAVKVPMIIASTSSPMSTMLPFTIFILFFSSLIVSGAEGYDPMALYISSIPYMFYCMISIIFGFLYSHGFIPDIGLIKKLTARSSQEPAADAMDESFLGGKPGQDDLLALILPVLSLLAALAVTYFTTGMIDFTPSVLTAVIVSIAYDLIRGRIKGKDISGILIEGFLSITPIMLILFVAFGFGRMVTATGFNTYVVGILSGSFSPAIVPVVLFLVGSLIAYATGSLTASAVIILPMGLPLAIATGAPLTLCIGACVSGAQFGDLSSPLSDNIIMPSASAGVSPVDTAKCLLPYRLITLCIAAAAFLVAGLIFC